MLDLIVATVVLALFYGAFWHNQSAREENPEREDKLHETAHFGALFARWRRRKAGH